MSKTPLALLTLFFFSGACSLVYQVVWVRMLMPVFGVSTFAVSIVLAAFMAGLALGSYWCGRVADRRGNGLRIYALLELGIGVFALIFPLLLAGLDEVYTALYGSLQGIDGAFVLVRLVLAFALLLVPTTLMGATLPTLSKAVAHRLERVGGDMGRLYAANTLGAATGCAVAAFFALEHLGVSGTTYAAAASNLLIALVAYRWSRDGQQEQMGVERDAVPTTLEFSEPVLFNDQFGVYEVTAEAPVKLSVVQSVIEAELLKEKLPPAVQALSARLRQELDFVVHDQALESVRGRIGQGAKAFSAEEREQPIYEHESGTFTIGDLLDFARELSVGFREDAPEQFDWFVQDIVEPRALLLAGAYTAGIDREEAVVAWLQKRQLSNLLVAMRRDVVDGVFASREEARGFYDRHPNLFRPLESIGVQEVLVRTEEEALALREEVERGGDLGALAAEHTLRRRGKANQGDFHLHPWEKQQFVPLFEAAQGQKIGALIGPIAVEVAAAEVLSSEPISGPYYAIFRLLDSTINAAPRPFAQAERRARALVRRQKQERLFGQLIIQLRHEYAAQIEVFRAQVEALVRNT